MAEALLALHDVRAGYGDAVVLDGIALEVSEGGSLALLGRNHPVGIGAAALVWATIERATQRLSTIGIPQEIGVILQGSFLLAAVIAYEVVNRWTEAGEARATAERIQDVPTPPAAVVTT